MAVNAIDKLQFLSFIVVRSTSQSYGDSKILGVRTPKPLNLLTKNLAWVIVSAMTPCMPKLKTIAPLGVWRHIHKISPLRGF